MRDANGSPLDANTGLSLDALKAALTEASTTYATAKLVYGETSMQAQSAAAQVALYQGYLSNFKLMTQSVDATTAAIMANQTTSALTKYLTGYVDAEGNRYSGNYYRENYGYVDSAPGIIHGWLQYPMVVNGFQFKLKVSPVITGKAASMKFDLAGNSLLGWNSDGSARSSKSEISTTVQLPYTDQEFVLGGVRKSESVRGNTGLPYLKDLPIIGRLFSTETESIKQSQLVVIAKVEYSRPDSFAGAKVRENLGKIVKGVNKGMNSRVGNMFFGQYGLDSDRADRNERLDDVGNKINDEYKTIK